MKLSKHTLLWAALTVLIRTVSVAQPSGNIPVSDSPSTAVQAPYPGLVNMANPGKYNYIQSITPDQPLQSLPASGYQYRQQRDYFDGLGRPLQSIQRRAHADGNDIIQVHVYDSLGRERYQYLPYANQPFANQVPGTIQLHVNTMMRNFYDLAGPDEAPYSRTDYEASVLSRPLKQLQPGRAWVGGNRGVRNLFRFNTPGEVMLWNIDRALHAKPYVNGTYNAGELSVTETTDEDGRINQEFKDKDGRLVLQKRYVNNPVPYYAHTGYACTYYVYDDQGRLRFVIPPQAVYNMPVGWDVDPIREFCYSYEYDRRGRLIERKIPGKAVEEFVYDDRDRQIFSRDGNQKQNNQWAFTIYDASDRPVITGLGAFTSPRDVLQGLVDDPAVVYPPPDMWAYIKNYSLYNTYPTQINGATILGYTYYDDYSQLPGFSYDATQYNGELPAASQPQLEQPVWSRVTRGLVTGTKVRVLDGENPNGNQWLTTVNYYDTKGRLLQSQGQNINGGLDISSNLYYFQGMPWRTILRHQNPRALIIPGATDSALTIQRVVKTFTRNTAAGGGNTLVGKLEQKINGNPFNIANYSYDHLNRVVVKDGRACMTLNEYNIRGFLTHIAAEDHSQPTISRFFDERLRYEWGFRDKHYNGNIAGITWSGGDGKRHAYGYTYDSLDRLTHAEHRHLSGGNWVNTDWNYTASNISYDLNGNIKTMNQKGGSYPGAAQNMDILSYQYGSNSNQLQSVEDAGTAISGLPDFRNGVSQAIEYTYDQNGNMTRDDNKGLTVSYNHLNKPAAITVSGKGSIYYTYDAGGNLLRKKLDSAGVITLYDYFGNFVYKSDVLQYITNEEGRARPIANDTTAHLTRFVYDYFVKDHLGNVRSTVTAEPINRDYLARHEMATAGAEQLVFDNIPNVRESKPGSTNPGDGMAARLEGGNPNTQVGTAIMLKVMPGDKFEISADSYYEGENQTQEESGAGPVISSLMNALMGGGTYAGTPVSELPDNLKTISGLLSNPVLPEQLRGLQSNDNPMVPKAHINYLFFDSKMQLVTDLSGSIQVQGGGPSGWHNSGSVTIGPGVVGNNVIQPSYVIIYIDNQTIGKNVWFDNMRVEHYTSKLLEEDHYYPFGLTVGIDQAAQTNLPEQPYKYQGIELERHFGLEMYETFYRGLDPQLGRFMQVDPKAEAGYSMSPYVAMDNNPVSKIDPLGDLAGDGNGDKEKPSAFATGVATLMNAIGIIGRGTAPPWTETGSRNGKNPQNAKELVEDFKSGVDMMMLLGAPLQMLSAESALPAKVESKAIESELSMAPRAAEGGLKITVAEEVGESMVRVRHHTSAAGLKGIKSSMSINASRGKPYGVDVEVAPFVKPSEANMGQAGKGAYTEFSVQKSQLSPIKGYMGGNGNAARIVTEGAPLKINNADPKFIKWDWFNFGSH